MRFGLARTSQSEADLSSFGGCRKTGGMSATQAFDQNGVGGRVGGSTGRLLGVRGTDVQQQSLLSLGLQSWLR